MKLATGILILGMGLGTVGAQNPSIIDNTKAKLNAVQQQKTADSNAALAASPGQSAKPQAATPAAKPAPAKSTGAAAKPDSGKPTAAVTKSVQSGPQIARKTIGPVPAKPPVSTTTKQQISTTSGKAVSVSSKQQSATVATAVVARAPASRPVTAKVKTNKTKKTTTVVVNKPAGPKATVAVEDMKNSVDSKKDAHKTISMVGGRRDPFLSPVVNHSLGGSGCSTGKRCLAVDQIALTGIVKSDAGMIAVVINTMNKAYFLRENDPVFNGYVVKITGDSIVFKETMQDKLGKPFTREVTKKISTPAV